LSGISVDVAGLATANLTDATYIDWAPGVPPVFEIFFASTTQGFILGAFDLTLPSTFDLINPVGPVMGTPQTFPGRAFNTTDGAFIINSLDGDATFTTTGGTPLPEPAAIVLLCEGLAGIAILRSAAIAGRIAS
jgi:hypothetical protein